MFPGNSADNFLFWDGMHPTEYVHKLLGDAAYALVQRTNNNFASATVITGTSAKVTGSNFSATTEPGEPNTCGGDRGRPIGLVAMDRAVERCRANRHARLGFRDGPECLHRQQRIDTQLPRGQQLRLQLIRRQGPSPSKARSRLMPSRAPRMIFLLAGCSVLRPSMARATTHRATSR